MDAPALNPALSRLVDRIRVVIGDDAITDGMSQMMQERAPDEGLALAFLLQIAEQSPAAIREVMLDRERAGDLVFCLGASELVGSSLRSFGPGWASAFDEARNQGQDVLSRSIVFDATGIDDRNVGAEALAAFKRRIFLHIAVGDLLGSFRVADTMAAMSRLADECIRAALAIAHNSLRREAAAIENFCVVALGKLGAGELNLSSDIDLMYLSASDEMSAKYELHRLGEVFTEVLSSCFRTDLRLRPGGRNSGLVLSVDAALGFYQNFGQTWERAAMVRARPVAGALRLGQRMLSELGRFIYRSYLDFDTLRQLRAMKRQIEHELRSPDLIERNVKLGYGGIRELEFIVQALTLIYGGRDPRIRTPTTLDALERLERNGYMGSARAHDLHEAYLFLRDVEHKLQVAAGLQTHTLPDDDKALGVLVARMRFGKDNGAVSRFKLALAAHRELVAMQFRDMLAGGEERIEVSPSASVQAAWRAALEPQQSAIALSQIGFTRSSESAANLELLARGPSSANTSPQRRELLERLVPILLDEISKLADPDLALMNLASFISAVGARTSFLSLLDEHPPTRRVLLRLFASSSYLSTLFIRHPELLDTLVRSDLARLRRSEDELAQELGGLVAACDDFESQLNAIRSFRHQEFLRIAIADLAGDLELEDVQAELARLAVTVLREALGIARAEVALRYDVPADLRLCVVAMGRLGAAEMSYNSDLDLIFVYHAPGEVAAGGREIASRLMQKLIAILEARTREGYAYKIDVRLRPSGNAGPLVTSLDGFREYHRQSSAVWERQSLVRARAIGGDTWLADQVEEARQEFVFGRGLSNSEVSEIAAMRGRMEKEIGAENSERLNLKQGRGGLVDVEFITQMMALRHGREFAGLRQRSTLELIRALAESRLFPADDVRMLEDDYRFLSRLENRLRIETDQAAWALPTALDLLGPVARRMGYEGGDAAGSLLTELAQRRSRVRAFFDACFSREQRN